MPATVLLQLQAGAARGGAVGAEVGARARERRGGTRNDRDGDGARSTARVVEASSLRCAAARLVAGWEGKGLG